MSCNFSFMFVFGSTCILTSSNNSTLRAVVWLISMMVLSFIWLDGQRWMKSYMTWRHTAWALLYVNSLAITKSYSVTNLIKDGWEGFVQEIQFLKHWKSDWKLIWIWSLHTSLINLSLIARHSLSAHDWYLKNSIQRKPANRPSYLYDWLIDA
jgi:hypothetical protein